MTFSPDGGFWRKQRFDMTGLRFAVVAAVLMGLTYPGVVLGVGTFVFRDYGFFGYPLAHYHRSQFWNGEVPLWNPLSNCGIPFLAQWNTLVCYPPSLLYLLLPMPWALGFFTLLHWFLGATGMYRLARSWTGNEFAAAVAGFAFAFNGLTVNCLVWPHVTAAMGWMPWVVLAALAAIRNGQRRLVWAAVLGTFQMLTGAPEVILLTWGVVVLLFFTQNPTSRPPVLRAMIRLLGIVLLVSGLACLQLLPFFDLLLHSNRHAGGVNTDSELPLHGWANLLVPLFRCARSPVGTYYQPGQFWTTSVYCGGLILALAFCALGPRGKSRCAWLMFATVMVLVVLAFGDHAGVYPALRRWFPPINFINYPVKFLLPLPLLLALMAAIAIANAASTGNGLRAPSPKRLILAGAILCVLMGGIVAFAFIDPASRESRTAVAVNGAFRLACLVAGIGLMAACFRYARQDARGVGLIGLALLLVLWLDLRFHAPEQNPTVATLAFAPGLQRFPGGDTGGDMPPDRLMLSQEAWKRVDRVTLADPLYDYLGHRLAQAYNCNLLDGNAKVDGFYPLFPREHFTLLGILYGRTNPVPEGLMDFLGVSRVSSPGNPQEFAARSSSLPLVTIGQKPLGVASRETPAILASDRFDPRTTVLVPPEVAGRLQPSAQPDSRVLSVNRSAHAIEIEVETRQATCLVVAQTHHRAWRARVNGAPAEIIPANHAFQALVIPPGRVRVFLKYSDRLFLIGLLVSVATLAGMMKGAPGCSESPLRGE